MSAFTAHDLKPVPLDELKDAASNLEIAKYGKKADIASRIVAERGGKAILKQLIKTSHNNVKAKESVKRGGPKEAFMKKERARLIASGVTDKEKISEEVARLWTMKTSGMAAKKPAKKPVKKAVKKAAKPAKACNLVTTKLLADAECKARELTYVGSDFLSSGKPLFKYKGKQAAPSIPSKKSKRARINTEGDESDSDADVKFDEACAEVEERAISRLKAKKIKREHINGVLEGFGVDASAWTMSQAKEEVVVQMLNETDDEDSDDEEEGDDGDESDDESESASDSEDEDDK